MNVYAVFDHKSQYVSRKYFTTIQPLNIYSFHISHRLHVWNVVFCGKYDDLGEARKHAEQTRSENVKSNEYLISIWVWVLANYFILQLFQADLNWHIIKVPCSRENLKQIPSESQFYDIFQSRVLSPFPNWMEWNSSPVTIYKKKSNGKLVKQFYCGLWRIFQEPTQNNLVSMKKCREILRNGKSFVWWK